LNDFHVNLDNYIYLMLLVNKTPGYAQTQASILVMAQEMVDTTDTNVSRDKYPKPLEYAKTLEASWEQCRLCSGNERHTKNANYITAVKNKRKDPQFNQQQRQGGQQQQQRQGEQQQQQRQQGQQQQQAGGSSGNGQNGKKKHHRKWAGKNQENHHDHSNIAAPAFVPLLPTPLTLLKQPLESHIEGDRPLASKGKGQFPCMQWAMDLLQEMGVSWNFKHICAIEEVVDAAYHSKQQCRNEFEQGSSSCPSKRAHVMPPLKAQIDWTKEVDVVETSSTLTQGSS
jgi:hypothetical protein